MHLLAHTIIFLILLPLYYSSNCDSCGYGYCLKNSTSNGNCINCACPSGFSGDCCEVEPADGCTPNPCPTANPNEHYQCVNYTGGRYQCECAYEYYGANCSEFGCHLKQIDYALKRQTNAKHDEVYCSPYDGTGVYIDNSAINYLTPVNSFSEPRAKIPCGNGAIWCFETTDNVYWDTQATTTFWTDIVADCSNPCIIDLISRTWAPNDYNYTRFFLRPYCGSAASCGVYLYQSWFNSNGDYIPPTNSSSGLALTSNSNHIASVLKEQNSKGFIPIGQNAVYSYERIAGFGCNGCSFSIGCTLPTVPPTTPPCSINCLNGGMCVVAANGTSYCECLDIWTGSDCSTFVPCAYFQNAQDYSYLNGGTCFSNNTYFPWYTCLCPSGYVGSRCEINSSVAEQIAAGMSQSNFNQQYLPFILANMTIEEKMSASWQVTDLFAWAAYEDTELDLNKDLSEWYEPEMGNCFTFNHQNATKVYNLRYSGEHGGFRAQMNINQAEYLNWVYTASMLVFLHRREETIMGESVSYQVAPGEETTFVIQKNVYTRLGKPYGKCIQSKTEVKSYYNPGSAYTIDSCIRSCYQDYVQQICGCMDPKYYMAYNATPCDLSKKDCVDNIALVRGQPSTWSECYCPPPCYEYIVDVAWTKTVFKTVPTQCEKSENSTDLWYEECMANYTSNIAFLNVQFPRLYHKSFVEVPKYTLSSVLSSLYNITGLILGLAVISIFEFAYLVIRLFYVICMNKEAIDKSKIDRQSHELAKKNCFNVPTVCPENPLQR